MKTNNTNPNTISEQEATAAMEIVKSQLDTDGLQSLDTFMTYAISMCTSQVSTKILEMAKAKADEAKNS
jgi:hypothetical protein